MRGVPVRTWRDTHGCVKDLSFWVTFNVEDITIQETITQIETPCHMGMLSIPSSPLDTHQKMEFNKQWDTQK